jgi:hypothetical protein
MTPLLLAGPTPVRDAFNAYPEAVRVVALVSPT